MSEKGDVTRDDKGRVVPGSYFGVDYGAEVDNYLEPLSDQEYTKMAQEGKEAARLSLEESGYQNRTAFQVGYEIQRAQDKIESIGNSRFFGKKKFKQGGELLGDLVDELKTVPANGKVPINDVGARINDVLRSLRLKYSQVGLPLGGFGDSRKK